MCAIKTVFKKFALGIFSGQKLATSSKRNWVFYSLSFCCVSSDSYCWLGKLSGKFKIYPSRRGSPQGISGNWAVYYTSPQKYYNSWFFKLRVQTCQTLIKLYRRVNLSIGDVHQFIGHCIIPLDPWALLLSHANDRQLNH